MRVTLDLADNSTDRLAGTIKAAGQTQPIAFDGWLDLMRLLESIVQAARTAGPPEPDASRPHTG
jgi:hypothetical protein